MTQTLLSYVLIVHPLAIVLATLQLFAKLEVSSFIRSKCRRSQYLKIRPLDLTTPVSGYFVMCKIGLPKFINVQNSTFLASPIPDIWKRVLNSKFGPWTLTTPLLGVFCHGSRWDLPRSICALNLTFLASPVPNLGKGF